MNWVRVLWVVFSIGSCLSIVIDMCIGFVVCEMNFDVWMRGIIRICCFSLFCGFLFRKRVVCEIDLVVGYC